MMRYLPALLVHGFFRGVQLVGLLIFVLLSPPPEMSDAPPKRQPTIIRYGEWLERVERFLTDLANDDVRFVDVAPRAWSLLDERAAVLSSDDKRR